MVERDMQLKHRKVFGKLQAMANPRERTTQEHIKLYYCYVDMVRQAVTHEDREIADRHLGEARTWFESKVRATDFRNKQRGADAEAF
jgi:hypothetical protein